MAKLSGEFGTVPPCRRRRSGFSLAELLAALTIGAMVFVAVLTIYNRAEKSAAAITRALDESQMPFELLQRICEDVDRMISSGANVKMTIENKYDEGFPSARLAMTRTIIDSKNNPQTLEEIVWQSGYDLASTAGGLVLYRSYSGISVEDKLLDGQRADWEKNYPFVPICAGLTMFRIQAVQGENSVDQWVSDALPFGVKLTFSFAEPIQTAGGVLDVPEEDRIVRTIVVDRTRKIKFDIEPAQLQTDVNAVGEPNTAEKPQTSGKPGATDETRTPKKPGDLRKSSEIKTPVGTEKKTNEPPTFKPAR